MRSTSAPGHLAEIGVTISLTFSCPFSRELKAIALPRVAAALPMATPMIVPLTPKNDSAKAARTAPMTEAATCLKPTFTASCS